MSLTNSYLTQVSRFLPEDNREDILAELRDAISEQVDELAAARGSAPGAQDEADVLRRFGHPLKVASGYRPQRSLIGPALFPAFVHTLKIVLIIVLALQFLAALSIAATSGSHFSLSGIIEYLLKTAFIAGAIVVAVFASIDYSGEQLKWFDAWRPESLTDQSTSVIRHGDVVTNLITEGVFLLWWNDLLVFQNWLPASGGEFPLALASGWDPMFWPLNVVIGASFILHAIVLLRGLWDRVTLISEITFNLSLLAIAAGLLTGGPLVAISDPALTVAHVQNTARVTLLIVCGFIAWDVFLAARLLRRQ